MSTITTMHDRGNVAVILNRLTMTCTFGKEYLRCETLATASSLEVFFTDRLNGLLAPIGMEVSKLRPMRFEPAPEQIKTFLGDHRKFVKITATAYLQESPDQFEEPLPRE